MTQTGRGGGGGRVLGGRWGMEKPWRGPRAGPGSDLSRWLRLGGGRTTAGRGGQEGRPLEGKTEQRSGQGKGVAAFSSTSSQHSTSQAQPVSANRSNGGDGNWLFHENGNPQLGALPCARDVAGDASLQ